MMENKVMGEDSIILAENDKIPFSDTTKEGPNFSNLDYIFIYAALILGFCFSRFVLWNITGFFTTIFFMGTAGLCLTYLKKSNFKLYRYHILQFFLIIVFSLTFSITANNFIKFLDIIFVTMLGINWVYSVCNEKKSIEHFFFFTTLKSIIILPFSGFSKSPKAIKFSSRKSRFSNDIRLILAGLIVTIPLTLIVASLLISADKGVEDMLAIIFGNMSIIGTEIIIQMIIGIPIAFYIFGMLYANVRKEKQEVLTDEKCEISLNKMQITPNIAMYSAVSPICILYVMFFISQLQYFLSAFQGNLPQDYSYSEYARRGFFELCVISIINLIVILFISLFAKQTGENKPVMLKVYSTVISVFTILIITTAMSKMVMYIGQYGLTQLRIYTSWFMILLAIVFVLIIIKQFNFKFNFAKYIVATFVIMFGILCFSNIDRNIAKYNYNMYQAGKLEELDVNALCNTSDDGLVYILQQGIDTKGYLEGKLEALNRNPYNTYNISSYRLKVLLQAKITR